MDEVEVYGFDANLRVGVVESQNEHVRMAKVNIVFSGSMWMVVSRHVVPGNVENEKAYLGQATQKGIPDDTSVELCRDVKIAALQAALTDGCPNGVFILVY